MDNKELLAHANYWTEKSNEHIRLADFCEAQAQRFLAAMSVEQVVEKPTLVLLEGGLSKQSPGPGAA